MSFEVNEGEVVSLIGANGAGKTTILRTLSGLVRPSAGKIEFWDKKSKRCLHKRLWHQDFLRVPEGRHVFPGLTVMENLEMGAFLKKNREEESSQFEESLLSFPSFGRT